MLKETLACFPARNQEQVNKSASVGGLWTGFLTPKAFFDALKDFLKLWFDDLVEDLSAVSFAGKETAALHEAKVFRSHRSW